MSIRYSDSRASAKAEALGALLRKLREEKGLPLRVPAGAAEIDSALLSKIELGQRAATAAQLAALAGYFGLDGAELEARRIAEEMFRAHGNNPAFAQATAIIREEAGEYLVKKPSAAASKPSKAVSKLKKVK